jgi:preprotein translocase subunit SecA
MKVLGGSRWSQSVHEFVEVKEGLEVKNQGTTIASIAHPTFFDRYKCVYGLTGTVGEDVERDEIFEMYYLDTFDVSPHRPCKRVCYKTSLVGVEEEKIKIIVEKINNYQKMGQPVLVMFQLIQHTETFSMRLRKEKIPHYVINDKQPEDEDYILRLGGQPGAVTVATNEDNEKYLFLKLN